MAELSRNRVQKSRKRKEEGGKKESYSQNKMPMENCLYR